MPEFAQMYPSLHTNLQAMFKKKGEISRLSQDQQETVFAAVQVKYTPNELRLLDKQQQHMPSGEQVLAGLDNGISSPQATQELDNFYGFVTTLI